jgi:hypothetical protein
MCDTMVVMHEMTAGGVTVFGKNSDRVQMGSAAGRVDGWSSTWANVDLSPCVVGCCY